ncbi:MAG: FxLYD domain-containing protein [Candidatus Thiodiazotropha sp.]
MESLNTWKLIKAGFWLGIGFIIPSILVYFIGTYLIYSSPFLWQSMETDDEMNPVAQYMEESDRTTQIKILEFSETIHNEQLLILGVFENSGTSHVSSIRLEAELLDENKKMVYECSEYISRKLKGGEKENFQVKCGCSGQATPEYDSVSLRVVSASSY